jgi:hypothetical protein
MKMRLDARGTTEDESEARKTRKRDPTYSTSPKMSPGAQNMKTEPDDLVTAENESKWANHEYGFGRPLYR